MEPQKSIVLPLSLAILASAIVFGGLGYYFASNKSAGNTAVTPTYTVPTTVATTQFTATPTPVATTTTTTSTSNIFDIMKAKVGDEIGDLTIKSVDPYIKGQTDIDGLNASGGKLSNDNAKIAFTGETTLTGTYKYVNNEAGIGGSNEICIINLDLASLKTFPLGSGDKDAYFCFTNIDLAKSQLTSTVGATGVATVTVKNYVYNVYPSEVHSAAELVKVVSKQR